MMKGVARILGGSGVAVALSAAALAQPGGPIPDGSYTCGMWVGSSYVTFGTVRSVGGTLSPNPVAKAGGTITGASATKDGITIDYTTARGNRENMHCTRG